MSPHPAAARMFVEPSPRRASSVVGSGTWRFPHAATAALPVPRRRATAVRKSAASLLRKCLWRAWDGGGYSMSSFVWGEGVGRAVHASTAAASHLGGMRQQKSSQRPKKNGEHSKCPPFPHLQCQALGVKEATRQRDMCEIMLWGHLKTRARIDDHFALLCSVHLRALHTD